MTPREELELLRKQRRLQELEAKAGKPSDNSQPVWSGALQQFNQGLSLGGADEISAGIDAVTGGNYERSMETQRKQREQFQQEHPWISGTATALGAAAPVAASLLLAPETAGASTAGAGARALQLTRAALGGGNTGRVARTTMEAAKEGARAAIPVGSVAGALTANPGERTEGAVTGAVLGGGVGAGVGAAAHIVPTAAEAVTGAVRRGFGLPTQSAPGATSADLKILKAMEESGVSPEQAASRLAEAKRLNVPLGLLDVGGTQTQRYGRSIRTLPGEGSDTIETALSERAAAQPDRVTRYLERALGTKATGNGQKVIDNLWAQSRNQSGPFYRQLENLPEINDQTVRGYFGVPAIQNIIQDAEAASAAWGRPRAPMYDDQGALARNPRFTDVDLVNQNINEMMRPTYSTNPRPVQGAPVATRTERQLATDARRGLVSAADAAPGGSIYSQARSNYAGPADARNYYESGLDFGGKNVSRQDVSSTLLEATNPQRKWYRRGQIEALRQGIDTMPDLNTQPNVLRSFWGNREARDKLSASVPNIGTRGRDLENRLWMENDAARTNNLVRSGSQTADKAAEAIEAISPDTVIETVKHPVMSTVKAAWTAVSGTLGKETRAQAAKHLTSFNNPEQSLAYLSRLQELQRRGQLNAQTIDAAAAASANANQQRE